MTGGGGYWEELERPAPDAAVVDGVELRRGSRVRLRPRAGGDIFDVALDGRTAVVDQIDADLEGTLHLAVTIDDDPGSDLGAARQPGHRFFFSLEEVEPLGEPPPAPAALRVLVAGIGNVFLGDDGFGVAVADQLGRGRPRPGVDITDFGIRGMDLAYALADYDVAILVDAIPRGGAPGTVYVLEVDELPEGGGVEAHGMDPVRVLGLAGELGNVPERVLVVGCEPKTVMSEEDEEVVVELSEPVRAAIQEAARQVEELLDDLLSPAQTETSLEAS